MWVESCLKGETEGGGERGGVGVEVTREWEKRDGEEGRGKGRR